MTIDNFSALSIIVFVPQNIAGLCKGSTADSDSVCEGSNPSPAAMMTTGNCIYAVPRAPILKFVFALFVVLPDLVPVPAPYCAILQGPHHVVSGSDVLAPQNRLSICSLRLIPVTAGRQRCRSYHGEAPGDALVFDRADYSVVYIETGF